MRFRNEKVMSSLLMTRYFTIAIRHAKDFTNSSLNETVIFAKKPKACGILLLPMHFLY